MVLLVLCTVCLACGWSGVLLCCCVCLWLGMCGLIAFGWSWVANVLPVGLGSLGMGTVKEDSHAGGYWLSCAYARSGVWLGVFGKYQRLHLLPAICVQDSLAERSKAVAQGAIPKGRGLEPHSCHVASPPPTPSFPRPSPALPPPSPRPSPALPPPAPAPHPWGPCTRLPPCGPIAPPASAPSPLRSLALPLQRPPHGVGRGGLGGGRGGRSRDGPVGRAAGPRCEGPQLDPQLRHFHARPALRGVLGVSVYK